MNIKKNEVRAEIAMELCRIADKHGKAQKNDTIFQFEKPEFLNFIDEATSFVLMIVSQTIFLSDLSDSEIDKLMTKMREIQ